MAAATSLSTYNRKRNFALTPEPRARTARGTGDTFVVQQHWATREHFDLRLEVDGAMKSWAVTRGPSNDPKDKRLAVRVEDHPMDYNSFEGTIPKPQYGGGTVMIWDRGTWNAIEGDAVSGLRAGKLKIEFHGSRMRGVYNLVRMQGRGGKRENWLLIKDKDEYAKSPSDLLKANQKSIATGRTRKEIEEGTQPRETSPSYLPEFIKPMLCGVAAMPPDGPNWLHEIKYDGYRLQIAKRGPAVVIRTREGLDWTNKFTGIAKAAGRIRAESFVIDGEAVVLGDDGLSDFALLQQALKRGHSNFVFMAFDLLWLNGKDLRKSPLTERKVALRKLVGRNEGALRFVQHLTGNGPVVFDKATSAGAEGIISKKANATYRSERSSSWLKIKLNKREDVAIVGYTPSLSGRKFGALVAAFGNGKSMRIAGRVGTGFNATEMNSIFSQLAEMRRLSPPAGLQAAELAPRNTVWVEPKLRAEVAMTGLTENRQLRHPRFLALRNPAPHRKSMPVKQSQKKHARHLVEITHADRIVFSSAKVTKGDVANYYSRVAELIMPHLTDRPVSFLRVPENIDKETFFQRHPLNGMSRGIQSVPDPERKHDDYIVIEDADGLRTCAQFGVIELHGWGSRLPQLASPDRAVFDFDPDPSVPFEQVNAAAFQLRKLIEALDLQCFPLLSGGKGIHVVVPLDRTQSWEDIETFTKGLAKGLANAEPETFIATASKERRKGKIYIDWLRNKMTATAIVPWSLRARKFASIAVPLSWNAIKKAKSADAYSIHSKGLRDGWPGFFSIRQSLPREVLQTLKLLIER
jgi:bifunctional non-homologous end joining protein LigD